MSKVLIIDHSKSMRNTLRERLGYEGFSIETAENEAIAQLLMEKNQFDLILSDSACLEQEYGIPMIVLSNKASSDITSKVTPHKRCFHLTRPFNMNRLLEAIHKLLSKHEDAPIPIPEEQPKNPTHSLPPLTKDAIIGSSPKMVLLRQLIDKVAPSEARVLITGENGSGKELVAHWLHAKSSRAKGPFVAVNCAAIPSELIESELFGHERGAFTSAVKQRRGKFELAHGGTLFMDEIGDMSLSAQTKVLRTLQERTICRVGSDKDIAVNVRIIAATNKDLREEIRLGHFREDLYHRIAVLEIRVPPLREHPEDIPVLVDHFLDQIAKEYKCAKKKINSEAMATLKKMKWSGNIRELRNMIERLVVLSLDTITKEDVLQYC